MAVLRGRAAFAAVAAVLIASLAIARAGPMLSALPIDIRLFNATYTGRGLAPDSQVFSNELVVKQSVEGAQTIFKNLLSGKKVAPGPAESPKRKVREIIVCSHARVAAAAEGRSLAGEHFRPHLRPHPRPHLTNTTPQQPTTKTKQKVTNIECTNSVAPAPLNWKMWCPSDANITEWTDSAGATHRNVVLKPQPEITATEAVWFIANWVTGNGPMFVEHEGKKYYWYHLWHPLDHVEARNMVSMSSEVPGMTGLYTLIHERYRQPKSWNSTRRYETNAWFLVKDPVSNILKNRFHVGINNLGIWTWQLMVEFHQTKAGLVVDLEVVVGAPPKGWDERNKANGNALARQINDNLMEPQLASQRTSQDWNESINAITRHMVEEFSNLRHFVPGLYKKYAPMAKLGVNMVPSIDGI